MMNVYELEYHSRENYFAIANLLGPRYMDERIQKRGLDWSLVPSMGAREFLPFLRADNVSEVLDVGCGYGRDTLFFVRNGFNVTGVEYSPRACEIARSLCGPLSAAWQGNSQTGQSAAKPGRVLIVQADFRSWEVPPRSFDAAFSFKVLHQFRHNPPHGVSNPMAASAFVSRLVRCVRPPGLIGISTFSTQDHNYGKGKYIEEDTFDTRGHRPCAFYTRERFLALFSNCELVNVQHLSFEEEHAPDGKHKHCMWFGVARRRLPRHERAFLRIEVARTGAREDEYGQ